MGFWGVGDFFGKILMIKDSYFSFNLATKGIFTVFANQIQQLNKEILIENSIFKNNFSPFGAIFGLFSNSRNFSIFFHENYFFQNEGGCK